MQALALDLGASGGKIISGSFDGKLLKIKEIHRFDNHPYESNGHIYWNFPEIYNALIIGLRKSVGENFTSFGVDSFSNDYGLIDESGKLISPIYTYRDVRTVGVLEDMDGVCPAMDLYQRTGNQRARFNTLVQLAAQRKQQDSQVLDQATLLLFVPDLINYSLSGVAAAEYTISSVSQLFNRLTNKWDDEIMRLFDIPRKLFPEVVATGTRLGVVNKETLDAFGGEHFDIIAVGHHDTASAVAAVPSLNDSFAYISSGTWSLVGIETDQMITSEDAFNLNLANEGGVGGRNRLLKNVMGLWILQECQRQFAAIGVNWSYEELDALAKSEIPFRSLIDPNNNVFFDRGNMVEKIQNWCRTTRQPIPESPGQITRCIKESLALCYREALDSLKEVTGQDITFVHIVGGGARSDLLNEFAACALNIPVLAGPYEASAVGNLCTQFMARGEIANLSEIHSVVKASFETREYLPKNAAAWIEAYQRYRTHKVSKTV